MEKKKLNPKQKLSPKQKENRKHLSPQWKKGQSGNPNGRPKKENSYSDTLRTLLDGQEISVKWIVNGKKKELKVTSDKNLYYGIASAQIMEALEGNVQAQKEIVDRIQGKAQQFIKIDNEEDINEQFKNLANGLQHINTSTPAEKPNPSTN